MHGKPLVYFDNANTSQKPHQVIEAVDRHYREHNANVARAVHQLGEEATSAYEGARDALARFINAPSRNEVVLTSGTTQSINLVAYSYALPRLKPGDAILTTVMEHHANIVPWQLVAARSGATVKAAPINERGELIVEKFIELLTPEVKLACMAHVSNVLGTVNPVREIAKECRKRGIPLLVDGSQAVPHRPVDVQALGCDFYAVTGHKMLAPTGTGLLWAKKEHLDAMPPFFGGGEMIREVKFSGTHVCRGAAQVRGRYAEHSRFRRHGGGDRLLPVDRLRRDPRTRARTARLRQRAPARDPRPAHLRRSRGQGTGHLVPARWRPGDRPGHAAGPGRRGGAFRPSLRTSADAVLRRAGHAACLAGVLQHARGSGCLRGGLAEGTQAADVNAGPAPVRRQRLRYWTMVAMRAATRATGYPLISRSPQGLRCSPRCPA
ncbi:cysteine desulfurase-like protein, SufS subfamily [Rhodanobacter sp. 115]|nr:cysteine desulfurase-like protein, SufS subfamily [Rhodanobacter sp. 115]